MGVQAVGVEGGSSVHRFLQSPLLTRNDLWCNCHIGSSNSVMNALSSTDEVDNRFGFIDSAPGNMNLDDFLQNSEKEQSFSSGRDMANNVSAASSLQRQGSLAGNGRTSSSKKTADEIWREIRQSEGGAKNGIAMVKTENDPMTLEDFLTKAGAYTGEESSYSSGMGGGMNASHTTRSLSAAHLNLSPAPSIGALSDSPLSESGHKRDPSDPLDRIDRKLRRKIKNRESAARSRARKQAYHNELVSKVSRLEMENLKLKKEKEFENLSATAVSDQTRHQLRRTSSTSF